MLQQTILSPPVCELYVLEPAESLQTQSFTSSCSAPGPAQFGVDFTQSHKECAYIKTRDVRHPNCEYYSVFGGTTPCTLVRPSILNGVTSLIKIPARYTHHLVDIMTRLRAERSTIRIPVGAIYLSLPKNVQTGSGARPASYSMYSGSISLE
jgi:hypothetical protein